MTQALLENMGSTFGSQLLLNIETIVMQNNQLSIFQKIKVSKRQKLMNSDF